MVVKDGGHAVADALQIGGVGAVSGALESQPAVELPPHAVEDLIEIGRVVAADGQSPRQSRINMRVCVDEGGHDHLTLRVDELSLRVFCPEIGRRVDGEDLRTVGDNAPVFDVGILRVPRDDPAVCDQIHNNTSG